VFGVEVLPPQPEPLLDSQGVQRTVAIGPDVVLVAGVHEMLPEPFAVLRGRVQLPAEFAGVGDAQCRDGDVLHEELLAREEGEGVVREVHVGHFREDVAGVGAGTDHRRQTGCHVVDHDALGRLVADPRDVVVPDLAAGRQQEIAVFVRARDGDVGPDAAAFVAHQRVANVANV